ncbi:hypothetical protein BU26DRAFT_128370 [Trematosphaeria pertusa]|uniref:Uncharacterized protein n=1 Tax=Trematosphaeria pertusa TaxID=390896 RepID=A0A6A6HXP4_9PLEO|nr:uncharacterized protein BU26DRAFT_128370 [Trematosphaeria pertusa]KAF2242548.1 hypothetical protein BU26DRAFT_128370 [Trematosphaeria pertusa]
MARACFLLVPRIFLGSDGSRTGRWRQEPLCSVSSSPPPLPPLRTHRRALRNSNSSCHPRAPHDIVRQRRATLQPWPPVIPATAHSMASPRPHRGQHRPSSSLAAVALLEAAARGAESSLANLTAHTESLYSLRPEMKSLARGRRTDWLAKPDATATDKWQSEREALGTYTYNSLLFLLCSPSSRFFGPRCVTSEHRFRPCWRTPHQWDVPQSRTDDAVDVSPPAPLFSPPSSIQPLLEPPFSFKAERVIDCRITCSQNLHLAYASQHAFEIGSSDSGRTPPLPHLEMLQHHREASSPAVVAPASFSASRP